MAPQAQSGPLSEPAAAPAALHCSFCGRDNHSVDKLLAGPGVYICDGCVDACNRILGNPPRPGVDRESMPADAPPSDRFGAWERLPDDQLLRAIRATDRTLEEIRGVLQAQVASSRRRGTSWAAIGEALDVSRQAAWERFGRA